MSEKMDVSSNNGDANQDENHDTRQENGQNNSSLANFVTQNYEQQREARQRMGGNQASAADEERVDKFLERALSESRRMEAEVARSQRRQEGLYEELGQDRFHAWTMEHASEVVVSLPQSGDVGMNIDVNGQTEEADIMR